MHELTPRLNTTSANNPTLEQIDETKEETQIPPNGPGSECKVKIKRGLMSEFCVLYDSLNEPYTNSSMIEQISDEVIHVSLKQYPDQGDTNDVTIYEELRRLRYFGWQLRSIKYDRNNTLHLYFEKVDWRARESYGLMPTRYNNEKELWWLDSNEPARKEGWL